MFNSDRIQKLLFKTYETEGKIMNIICERDILNKAVTPASAAVSTKGTMQALDGFLLIADKEEGTLVICGYDLEKGVKVTVSGEGVQINESGKIVLNAAKFSSIVRNLDGDISIEVDSSFAAHIKSNRSEFTLNGLDADTFPLMPELTGERNLSISRKMLKNMISSTLFSVGVNSSTPALNGTLFEIKDNCLSVVASDGFRLSMTKSFEDFEELKVADESESGLDLKFVIPGKSLAELIKLIGDEEENAEIQLTGKHVIVSFDNIIFFSRLIESDFLDYRRVITQVQPKTMAIVDTKSFVDSVERAAILTDDKGKTEIRLLFKKEELTLESREESGIVQVTSTGTLGKVVDECDMDIYGDDLLIAFNHRYLHEALRAVKDEKIVIKLESAMKSLIILPYDEENGNNNNSNIDSLDIDNSKFLYLVLPLRMRD